MNAVEPTAQSRSDTKAETRQRLLSAARDVFMQVGYQGATLEEIAARAGFTKGALYWHFPNKRSVFLALVAESIGETLGVLDDLMKSAGDDPKKFEQTFGRWIDGIDSRETLPTFGVELEVESRRDPLFRDVHQRMIAQHEQALADYMGRYFIIVGREPPMPIDDLAATVVAILKGFALTRQNRPDMPVTSGKLMRMLMGMK